MSAEMKSIYSSHIAEVGYDPDTSEFLVTWDTGKTSVYSGVEAETAEQVMNAPSIGGLIHSVIRGKYPHRYLG